MCQTEPRQELRRRDMCVMRYKKTRHLHTGKNSAAVKGKRGKSQIQDLHEDGASRLEACSQNAIGYLAFLLPYYSHWILG